MSKLTVAEWRGLHAIAVGKEWPGYHQGALLRGAQPITSQARALLISRRQRAITELHSTISGIKENGERQTRLSIRSSATRGSDEAQNTAKRTASL